MNKFFGMASQEFFQKLLYVQNEIHNENPLSLLRRGTRLGIFKMNSANIF